MVRAHRVPCARGRLPRLDVARLLLRARPPARPAERGRPDFNGSALEGTSRRCILLARGADERNAGRLANVTDKSRELFSLRGSLGCDAIDDGGAIVAVMPSDIRATIRASCTSIANLPARLSPLQSGNSRYSPLRGRNHGIIQTPEHCPPYSPEHEHAGRPRRLVGGP